MTGIDKKEESFLERWNSERAMYRTWGECVSETIVGLVEKRLVLVSPDSFFKIPPTSRLKSADSLLQKAFYRDKLYKSPYDDIEDKVGVRFVVLLSEGIRKIEDILIGQESWNINKARDYETEIHERPYEFQYQSVHYIVCPKTDFQYNGTNILQNTPCEIQLRTLLQHAHAELTHDTLYKTNLKSTPEMKRNSAKSMALIEATGDYFDDLGQLISQKTAALISMEQLFIEKYREIVKEEPVLEKTPLSEELLDYCSHSGKDISGFEAWLNEHKFIGQKIREKAAVRAVFRMPIILSVYYFVYSYSNGIQVDCPLSDDVLELIYSDLGKSMTG